MGIIDIEHQDTTGWATGYTRAVGAEIRSIKGPLLATPPIPTFLDRSFVLLGRFGQRTVLLDLSLSRKSVMEGDEGKYLCQKFKNRETTVSVKLIGLLDQSVNFVPGGVHSDSSRFLAQRISALNHSPVRLSAWRQNDPLLRLRHYCCNS
jgi:hypothetical protein